MPEKPRVRTGQGSVALTKEQFRARMAQRFYDPAFEALRDRIDALSEVAWEAYRDGQKSPRTRKAGEGFADPSFDLAVEWLETRRRVHAAARRHKDARSLIRSGRYVAPDRGLREPTPK